MRIVQISDTHLSTSAARQRRTSAGRRLVNAELRPDLIVNTGDSGRAFPDQPTTAGAREVHTAFDAPVVYLPGNHDVGEPGPPRGRA